MGFQSTFNRAAGAIAAGSMSIGKTISEQKAIKAKAQTAEQIKSKRTGTKMSTRNTIQEVMKEATMGRLSDEQINTLAKDMNKKQRKEFKEKYIGEMNNGSDEQ